VVDGHLKKIWEFVWEEKKNERKKKRIINGKDFVHLRQDPAEMPGKKNMMCAVFFYL
jgi:hypothetical protein